MNKVFYVTSLGDKVEIKPWLLERHQVKTAAEKFFGCKVNCVPCVFGHNSVSVGWCCSSSHRGKILGFVSLSAAEFCTIKDYDYPINVVVPIDKSVTYVHGNAVCYTGSSLAIYTSVYGLS
ncbi:MAG: hypothetical protein IJ099_01200 [Alphaproteobacteria bacterium]|nr:hypothetical protein [Alphaproteobacteria bacterium]